MDTDNPFLNLNGLPNQEPAHQLISMIDCDHSNNIISTKDQTVEGSKVINDGSARGLELIYRVAEELAKRIADEKRYEGIIKPCSVKIQRISDASKFRIIRDGSLIVDEAIPNGDITTISKNDDKTTDQEIDQDPEDTPMECSDSSDDEKEEEMILPPLSSIEPPDPESPLEKFIFSCIFCNDKNIQGRSKAFDHYQCHMDYYPYKCAQCLEVTTDLRNLFIHYHKEHEGSKTVTFVKRLIPWITEWINEFLTSLMSNGRGRNYSPRPYCPVCEISVKKEEIIMIPANLIQSRKHLLHIHKHLLYEPFVCMICQKDGNKYTANEFDDKIYDHILKNHPEAEDEYLAKIFQKTRYIKPLEYYINHYLVNSGVSTRIRRPEKIPHFARNRYKTKHDVKDKINPDINLPTTLNNVSNQQSTTSLTLGQLNDQEIGYTSDNLVNLSNQTKGNPIKFITSTSHQTSSVTAKPVNSLSSPKLLLSPSKLPSTLPNLTIVNTTIPNVFTLTSTAVSMIPVNQPTINGVTSCQPIANPSIIQLPCGQIMIRKTVNYNETNSNPPIPAFVNKSPTKSYGSSLLRSPPAILRRASVITPPSESPPQNGLVQIQSCPDVTPFICSEASNTRKQEEEFVKRSYFCMFCKGMVKFESFTEGLFHFSRHLEYHPVNCLLCGDKFTDVETIMSHFVQVHPHQKICRDSDGCEPLLYYINREGHMEKWIEQYLYFQISNEFNNLVNVDCSPFCFICKAIHGNGRLPTRSINRPSSHIMPPVGVVRLHINLHLNYRPYECYLCAKTGNQVKFGTLSETALKHLRSHGFSPVDRNFNTEFFIHKPIPELENLIKNYLITEFYPYANTNTTRQENMESDHSIVQSFPLMSNGGDNLGGYSSFGGDKISKRLFIERNHTNGGSISSSPFSLTPPSSHDYDMQCLKRSILACYHCKLSINGINELVTHCKTLHPNLSIASYCLPIPNGIN